MALGKGLLGEQAVEKLKRGDLSELIKIGEKVLGEETVKDFLNAATEGAFAPKEDEEQEDDNTEDENAEEMSSGFVDEEMTQDTSNTVDPPTESTEEVPQTTEKVADEL